METSVVADQNLLVGTIRQSRRTDNVNDTQRQSVGGSCRGEVHSHEAVTSRGVNQTRLYVVANVLAYVSLSSCARGVQSA